ncbi:sigma-70 family RNA polymerase sigma factor [Caulobacter sp. KR2-114]|uniref:sigma-70 family RNA polymerase sigma factor n=1 Tax=Caulobacter sp. KR2-114 TaxID=3400912 RepID=UPI003BFEE99F
MTSLTTAFAAAELSGGCDQAALTRLIPHLRAFARALCRNDAAADDLTQEALASAWSARARYTAGTNLKAWVFRILRNQFYSDQRRSWRIAPLDPAVAEQTLRDVSNVQATLELDDVRRAIALLPDHQREALILVAVAGMPYLEAASICDCAEGTMKSRVSRARVRLLEILDTGFIPLDGVDPDAAMATLVADGARLSAAA